jgi:hypothetical protein
MRSVPSIATNSLQQAEAYEIPENVADNIRQALRGLQFGEIIISVRDGAVIQIDRVARKRQFKVQVR